jgi:hypothetical protein
MDDVFLTDQIDIVTTASDLNGVLNTTVQSGIKARISEKNKLILNKDGKEVVGMMQIIIKDSNIVSYESKIRIKKLCGADYPRPNKDFQIHQLSKGHGLENNFFEVWI